MAQAAVPTLEDIKPYVGKESEPRVYEVEKGMIRKFAEAIGDPNPLYYDEEYAKNTRHGGIVAPPTFVAYFKAGPMPEVDGLPWSPKLHGDDEIEFYRPIRPGHVITARARVVDVFEKQGSRGRMVFRVQETTLTDQRGERVAKYRMSVIYL